MGLLDSPVPAASSPLLGKVGGKQDQKDALQAARESITLLKNGDMPLQTQKEEGETLKGDKVERALPLDRSKTKKLLVVGPACNSLALQSGGWTKHWQASIQEGTRMGHDVLRGQIPPKK